MKLPLIIASFLTIASVSIAQTNGSNTPYSRYGFGLLNNRLGAAATAMSGTTLGIRDGRQLTPENPASYSAIDSLSLLFDVGYTLQNGNFNDDGKKINARNSSLDYITAGFRIAPKLGLAFGISPFSTIGYSSNQITRHETSTGELFETSTYNGNGGLHEAFIGLGWNPIKKLSIGANIGYLWGDMTNTVTITFSDHNINTRRREFYSHPKTYKLGLGLQFEQPIDQKNKLTLGLTYGLGHKINSSASFYDQRLLTFKTIGDTVTIKNAYELPHSFGVGLQWNYKNNLKVAFDYNFQKWKDVKYPTLKTTESSYQYLVDKNQFDNLQRFSLGAEYIPNPIGLKKSQQIRYRLGAAYTTPYIRLYNQPGPKSYQLSAGLGIPIINYHGQATNRCIFNVGVSFEHLSSSMSNSIKENYIRLHIGLTFNERWFAKWKAM